MADYKQYFRIIQKNKKKYSICIFAFCMLPTAIFFIILSNSAGHCKKFAKAVQKSYREYFQKKYSPEAGFKSRETLQSIPTDQELFEKIKQLEFLPVVEGLVLSPLQYRWSSCSYRVVGSENSILDTRIFYESKQGVSID